MRILRIKILVGVLFFTIILFVVFLILLNRKTYEVDYGISFSRSHAESLGLDWKEVYLEMLKDLKPKYIRISAPWNSVESEKGRFYFDDIDWQMDEAYKNNTKVVLVVGQKTPRWPECHTPDWVSYDNEDDVSAKEELFDYIEKVVERYKDHKALEIWQVENEPYISFKFGECENYHKEWVGEEIEFVRILDNKHKIMITDSGELSTWIKSIKAGDIFGTTIYRVIATESGRYFNYDWILPPVFYRVKALIFGRSLDDVFVSELQVEPWIHNGDILSTPIEEQEKSMNIKRLKKNLDFVTHIGTPRAYLWGVEWWYWMKSEKDNSVYWNIVKDYTNK
ncbi:MAG: beta-galactosidase [Candidatus Magasanikbacteria bacterium]|nr:beta-galactosidase [Candidatus Magasanikbacteria bacterium]